jgi:hypothetical protein
VRTVERNLSDEDLVAACQAGVIDDTTRVRLSAFLAVRRAPSPHSPSVRFDLTHVLWYAGALIVMSAMGVFTTGAFNLLGGRGLAAIAVVYAVVFVLLGRMSWRRGLIVPGGLMVTVAVAMVPLAIFGLQTALDPAWRLGGQGDPGEYRRFFEYVHGSWVLMEIGTVAAALVALRFFPFPFILFVGTVALWFMSMDVAVYFFANGGDDWETRREVSRAFGLAMILVGWAVDLGRSRGADYGFWLHLFGATALWGGLTSSPSSTEVAAAFYCLINIGFVLLSVYLGRRVYAVFGAAGIAAYLGHLAWNVFNDALLFSFALSLVGLAVIGLGLLYHRQRAAFAAWLDAHLPDALRALRPARALGAG